MTNIVERVNREAAETVAGGGPDRRLAKPSAFCHHGLKILVGLAGELVSFRRT
jgi:hypothetical protein